MNKIQTLIEKHHQLFKEEFGIHFRGNESELQLVRGFIDDVIKDTCHQLSNIRAGL
jgi:hypothetical protein